MKQVNERENGVLHLTLQGVPPSLNQFAGRANSWEYRAQKQRWTSAVQWLAKRERIRAGNPPAPPLAHVCIEYYFQDRRRRDPDNYGGKFLLDGLTKAGAIQDDSFGHITLTVCGKTDAKRPRTEITVMEMKI